MALAAGDRLGPYEISGPLGSGGMGDVYRARDPRLGRDVAIKVLPRDVATDPDRLRRFEQEARALAALNHPNILAVHDVGVADGVPYLVTELVDGDTLRVRVGSLPVRRSIEIAVSIATGLAAAHARGLVHRDLKPENTLVTRDGHVKIIDFGLALLQPNAGPTGRASRAKDLSEAATMTRLGTAPGVVLGTVGYMAPEQLRGETVDYRADIFAFGAVFYEMLTGRRAFEGATPADTMSAILQAEISMPESVTSVAPPMVEPIVLRCLEKDPAARFQSTDDLVFALKAVAGSSSTGHALATAEARSQRRFSWLWPAVAAASLVAAAASFALRPSPPVPARLPVVAFDIPLPEGMRWFQFAQFTASPDNSKIAATALDSIGQTHLLLRPLHEAVFREVGAGGGFLVVAWSPDSRYIASYRGTSLFRINASSGLTEEIARMPCKPLLGSVQIAWHAATGLVFSCDPASGLYQVSPKDNTVRTLTTVSRTPVEQSHG
jgi:eukaryotic-like serine/threonine-protein kinase